MIKGYEDEVSKIYEKIRDEETLALKKRKAEIAKKCPEILDIEKQIGECCLNLALSALKNVKDRDTLLKDLRERITELRMKKTELLVQNGYPITFLDKHYKCSKCKDTGYIGNKKCSCYKQKLIKLYYKDSDLSEMIKINNFSNFRYEYFSSNKEEGEKESPRKKIEKIVLRSQDFIKNFEHSKDNLLFYGNPGTGKTFLSHCIAKELLDRGFLVVYRTADDLLQNLKLVKFQDDELLGELILNCDLLIIDDLGTEQISDFSKSEFFNLLNKKLIKGKKMIVSTNFSMEDILKTYTERITSRLLGNFTPCKFSGDDIRIQKNYNLIKQR